MTKTERWYAIVEELRAVSPRPRSAHWLANRFEVSRRTIERDLDGLLQAGVPLYAEAGRTGGYVLEPSATFTPPALAAEEVIALAVAVEWLSGTPFAEAGRAAMRKLLGTLGHGVKATAATTRVGLMQEVVEVPRSVQRTVQQALRSGRVLHLDYTDSAGVATLREVEPLGFLGGEHWYLVAWCRLRQAVRGFRLDRIGTATVLDQSAPAREVDLTQLVAGVPVRTLLNSDTLLSPTPARVVP
jgi:predicted DNA-binding transcriptional regulator YafY